MSRGRTLVASAAVVIAALLIVGARGRELTSHPTRPSKLGTPSSSEQLLKVIDTPGELEVETVNSADWAVARAGLINLKHPTAKAAGLVDSDEPISLFFHAIRHPTKGLFIVDTGAEKAMRDDPDSAALSGFIVRAALHPEKFKFHRPLGEWLAAQPTPLQGVFLTHLHGDHISGMRDARKGAGLYAGPGESRERSATNFLMAPVTDRAFEGHEPLDEWQYQPDPSGRFAGVIDVFGDGQLWALWTPGHTVGATVYLARTKSGPVLMTGDACHTVWGWEHDVEPGEFSVDQAKSAESLAKLRALVREHPSISVRLGHQALGAAPSASPR
jgi:N-acyl homoserine lactone hydrolase